jgi:hypothetical protein
VEVGDHVHGPAWLGDDQLERGLADTVDDDPRRQPRTRRGTVGVDRDLHGDVPVRGDLHRRRRRDSLAVDVHPSGPDRLPRHPDNLKRSLDRPDEQLGRLHGDNTHGWHCAG